MRSLVSLICATTILIPCVVDAYKIDIVYMSNHSYTKIETAYRSESHIKEINQNPRAWRSADGKEKQAKLLELIGPNKVVLEMENPIISGLQTKFTLDSTKLAPEEQDYVRDLYHQLKYDYFADYANQEAGKWNVELSRLQSQVDRIDADIRAVQRQREAYLSSTTVNVDVMVNITNNYGFDGLGSSSYGTATASASTSSPKSTKRFDDLIRRLQHKKRDLPRLIANSRNAIKVNLNIREKAKADKLNYEKAKASKPKLSTGTISPGGDSVKSRLENLKQLYKGGLLSREVYEQKQREILDGR
jgi:hypothetical protein